MMVVFLELFPPLSHLGVHRVKRDLTISRAYYLQGIKLLLLRASHSYVWILLYTHDKILNVLQILEIGPFLQGSFLRLHKSRPSFANSCC